MRLKLLYVKDQFIDIDEDYIGVFGRDPECDIHIDNTLLSRQHGEFYVDQGSLFIRDLGSKNGIFINRSKVTDQEVRPGDKIKLGNTNFFQFVNESANAEQAGTGAAAAVTVAHIDTNDEDESFDDIEQDSSPQENGLVIANQAEGGLVKSEEPAPAVPTNIQKSGGDANSKKTIMYALVCVVCLIVSIAVYKHLFSAGDEPVKPDTSGPMSADRYNKILDAAASNFHKGKFDKAKELLKPAIDNFNSNDAAAILTDLSDVFLNKGERYETFDWARAESLSKELIDAHPVSKNSKAVAENIRKWINKEEPNMSKIQDLLKLIDEKKWGKALAESRKLPDDSSVVAKYQKEIKSIKNKYISDHNDAKEEALKKQNWPEAIKQLNTLIDESDNPEALEAEAEKYKRYIRDRNTIKDANKLLDDKEYAEVKYKLESIESDSPYFLNVNRLIETAQRGLDSDQIRNLYKNGNVNKALSIAEETESEDALLISKMKQIEEHYSTLQKTLNSNTPEKIPPICQKIMLLEPSKKNFYYKEAKKHFDTWSDSSVMAQHYVKLADDAYEKGDYQAARKLYHEANRKDDFYGNDGLKKMDKLGISYYNKAVFAIKGDKKKDAREFLRKAIKLLPKDSRYYERIIDMIEELNK